MVKKIKSKRVHFPKGEQNKFINKILLRTTIKDVTKICNFSERTIRDWRREKFLMDYEALLKLCKKINISIPPNIKLKDHYWYVYKGASIGGQTVLKKYGKIGGNPEYRKKKWYEWWEKEGKFKKNLAIKPSIPIKEPRKSKKLAEFVGIVMGDGGLTERQLIITLHHKDDREYGEFVSTLIKNLFNVPVSKYHRKKISTNSFVVSRTKLVKFCTEKLGLKIGNKIKQQIDIPLWVKNDKEYSIACVRGLVDTDGSVFTHKYKVNNKTYKYKKLTFTTLSRPLLFSVYKILRDLKLNPRIARDKDIWLDSIKDMQKYFQTVNSHNPKHLKRYLK